MSEEVSAARHDLDYWRRRCELAEAHRDACLEAEVDAILEQMNVIEVDQARARINDTLIPALAKMLVLFLVKEDGSLYNLIDWDVGALPDVGSFRLTLQRLEGKTAADLYREARLELEAAREVIAAAKRSVSGPGAISYFALVEALDAYDASRKEQSHGTNR